MAHWIGPQGQVYLTKKAKTFPHCNVTHWEPQIRNKKIFFPSKLKHLLNPQKVWTSL